MTVLSERQRVKTIESMLSGGLSRLEIATSLHMNNKTLDRYIMLYFNKIPTNIEINKDDILYKQW